MADFLYLLDKPKLNWHRHDYSDPDAHLKPSQAGTPAFIRELKQRHFKRFHSNLLISLLLSLKNFVYLAVMKLLFT